MTAMREKSLLIVILKGEIKIDDLSMKKYLNEKGIAITGYYFKYDRNIDRRDFTDQVNLIVELNKTLIGCKFSGLNRLASIIGKEVEDFKVQIKRLEKDYNYIVDKCCKNDVDKLILLEGKKILQQGMESVNYIYKHDYFGVIERSMNREEICIGRVDQGNLKGIKGKFEIGSIKDMTYNLVEEDLYKYIKRLQRRQFDIDQDELIKIFVHGSHLASNSFDYLRGLCSYPKDFLKTWDRYRENKKRKTDEEFLEELKKSMKYETNVSIF